jgi:ribosomal protein S18 acetylase RimI-like enzyme
VTSCPLEVREAREEEAAEIALLLNELYRDLHGAEEFRSQDVASWIRDPDLRTLVAVEGHDLVGWADAGPGPDVEPTWWLDVLVPARERRREIVERLVQETEDMAQAASPAGVEAKFYLPEADAQLRAVVRDRGYKPVSCSFRFERRLDGAPESAEWPAGTSVRRFRPRFDETIAYALHMETFADQAGTFKREPFDRWCQRNTNGSFDPSLWFIAEANGEPAGVCLCRPEFGADRGLAWISVVGVRRAWRRKGVGLALLLHAFGDLYRRGFPAVGLSVDGESPTGAPRLCERAGMTVSRRYDHYARHLG